VVEKMKFDSVEDRLAHREEFKKLSLPLMVWLATKQDCMGYKAIITEDSAELLPPSKYCIKPIQETVNGEIYIWENNK
jgi:hypothetical protein